MEALQARLKRVEASREQAAAAADEANQLLEEQRRETATVRRDAESASNVVDELRAAVTAAQTSAAWTEPPASPRNGMDVELSPGPRFGSRGGIPPAPRSAVGAASVATASALGEAQESVAALEGRLKVARARIQELEAEVDDLRRQLLDTRRQLAAAQVGTTTSSGALEASQAEVQRLRAALEASQSEVHEAHATTVVVKRSLEESQVRLLTSQHSITLSPVLCSAYSTP